MPMDALCLSAVLRETAAAVTGGRIDKIYQPSRDEVILQIRGREGACRLLLSANPARPRIQLTGVQVPLPLRIGSVDSPMEEYSETLTGEFLPGGKVLLGGYIVLRICCQRCRQHQTCGQDVLQCLHVGKF